MHQSLVQFFNPTRHAFRYKEQLNQPIHTRSVQNRDLPALSNPRAMLDGMFQRKFGLLPEQLDAVSPGAKPLDI